MNTGGLIASSEFGRRSLIDLGIEQANVPVVYPPVDLPILDGKTETPPRITYFGHLWAGRGVLDLAMAFSLIFSQTDAELVIASNNIHRLTETYLEAITRNNGTSSRLIRMGVVEDTLRQLLEPSSVVALPYRDTPSVKLLEAMAAGKAVITTNIGWIPELVHDGTNGILTQTGNIKQLAGGILNLLRDSDFALEIGRNARKTIGLKCDGDMHVKKFLDACKLAAANSFPC
jgi:glycosyltransferase involved in cell wall biosynthesis